MNVDQLKQVAVSLESAAGSSIAANESRAGYWKRVAAAAEALAGVSTSANESEQGYMLRAAKAFEQLNGTSGAEENDGEPGITKRLVDALEASTGAIGTSDMYSRFVRAALNAVFKSPALLTPADQTLFINAVVNAITSSRPAVVMADGVNVGSTSGNPATLNYTPTLVDNDVNLAVTANNLTSATRKVAVVAADNGSLWDFTTWALTNLVVTAGQADPFGGTTAYKVIALADAVSKSYRMSKGATGTPVTANSSGEVWISPIGTALPVFRFYPLNTYAEVKVPSKHYLSSISSMRVVETKVVAGRTWYRLWYRGENAKALSTLYIDLLPEFITANAVVASGEHGFYIYRPRYIDGALPFYDQQRVAARYSGVVLGVQEWLTRSPFHDGTDALAGTDFKVKVLLPATYNASRATPYPVVYTMGVEAAPNVLADELQVAKTAGYMDTYDCIFVEMTSQGFPWGSTAASGKHDHQKLVAKFLPNFMADYYNVSNNANDRILMGYSKGGWAAYQFKMNYPDVFGYAGSWDTPWDWTYANITDLAEQAAFETSATFDLYTPRLILPNKLSTVQGRTRLVLASGFSFTAKVTAFDATLTSSNVPHTYLTGLGTAHDAQAAWMGPVVSALFALRAAA